MLRVVLRRLTASIPLALGAATLVFTLLEVAPGRSADAWIGDRPVPHEVRERLTAAYGLDRPAHERYVAWLSSVALEGELGWSHSKGRPVRRAIAETLPATLLLSGSAMGLYVVFGIALGAWSVATRRSVSRGPVALAVALYAMPTFWVGLLAVQLFAFRLGWFPPSSLRSVGSEHWPAWRQAVDVVWHAALPTAVLGTTAAAGLAQYVRSGLSEALTSPHVRAAYARGLGRAEVFSRHALRTALLPVVNLVGLSLPVLVSGSLVVEVVFAWPGMGRLAYDAILARDVPVVLATTMLAALAVILGNLLADVAMAALDPRVRRATEARS